MSNHPKTSVNMRSASTRSTLPKAASRNLLEAMGYDHEHDRTGEYLVFATDAAEAVSIRDRVEAALRQHVYDCAYRRDGEWWCQQWTLKDVPWSDCGDEVRVDATGVPYPDAVVVACPWRLSGTEAFEDLVDRLLEDYGIDSGRQGDRESWVRYGDKAAADPTALVSGLRRTLGWWQCYGLEFHVEGAEGGTVTAKDQVMSPRTEYVVAGLVYDDEAPVTFEVETRAEAIDHDALLRLGVQHAREEHSRRPRDVHEPSLDDEHEHDEVRDWALCFARDRLTNFEQLDREINERNESEQVDPCERCRALEKLEQETDEDHPHGLDAGCKDCEANMYRANYRAEERRRLLALAVMAWVKTGWPELRVNALDLERWCPVTDDELAAAAGGLRRLAAVGVAS
jgi:hypothetical protein